MKVTIFANYGTLAHEKETVYSMCPTTAIYEELTVILPDEIYAGENHAGEILVDFDGSGCLYPFSRLLCNHNHNGPALVVPSPGKHTKYVDLEIVI